MNTQSIDDFLTQALDDGGALTPAQAAQLLEMGDIPGDTGSVPEPSSAPDAAPATDESGAANAKTETPTDANLNASNAVILAKDGKHTISYDKLVQARESERTARAESEQLRAHVAEAERKLADLQAQAQARANAGQAPTATDNQAAAAQAAIDAGANPELFGDFSPEAMAKGVAALVDQQVAARMAAIDAKLQPLQKQAATDATADHFNAIYSAHPDADSIAESQEFAVWKSSQPAIVRAALDRAMTEGGSADVIEVFGAFKAATSQSAPPTPAATQKAPSPAEAARAAIAKVAAQPPASLSDIPGGRVAGTNAMEAMSDMNGIELMDAMQNMSRDQIEAYLESQL